MGARPAPELLWLVEEDGWSLLDFDYVEGGHADYTPGSCDLSSVKASMIRLADVPVPAIKFKAMPHRLRRYVDNPAGLSWFAGSGLLHTEWNPPNVLITNRGALFGDWGWASTGAAWTDPALWLLWLIAHGHSPEQAEHPAAAHPVRKLTPAAGLDVFAGAQHRVWDSIAEQSVDDWATPMQNAAQAWHEHWQSQS
ncbi:aminoglycoside phosphotransferase [Streptomyces sp. NPDC059688]|uniref:aminoglycoside phosphotransferase n=1 Tax=Streptomyces sp. NPDC059688 TaxID=3346906 RepID=UPI0036ADAB88